MRKRIGILGAGQLGCLLAESLFELGAEVVFYDPSRTAPGFSRTPFSFCGQWSDREKLKEFFSSCDVVTYEFENVSTILLENLIQETQTPLFPSLEALKTTQNRIFEKTFINKNHFPVCEFQSIENLDTLEKCLETKLFPMLFKTATGGYDGKGQWKITTEENALYFLNEVKNKSSSIFPLIQEEIISIQQEFSCITARNSAGEMTTFPLFENEHKDHILFRTYSPADIPKEIAEKIKIISQEAAEKLNIVGLLTTEFFLSKENKIYVNEFAPRPHNSGHITRKSCSFSQFQALAHILLNIPLPKINISSDYHVMENILGDVYLSQENSEHINLLPWKNYPEIQEIILYGKDKPKEKRKMGHFIATGSSRNQVVQICQQFRKKLYDAK